MSRLLADARALTFDLPQDQLAMQGGMGAVRGGMRSPGGANLDPLNKLLEDELYQQEGRTEEYYKQIGALQSFANQMSSAGYDVTKPNLLDPDSIRLHRIYQEGLAQVYNTHNDLKRNKSMEDESLKNPNIRRGENEQGDPTFWNESTNDLTKETISTVTRAQNEQELQEAYETVDAVRNIYMDQLMNTKDRREAEEIRAQIQQLDAARGAVGITPNQREGRAHDESKFQRNQKRMSQEAATREARMSKTSGGSNNALDAKKLINIFESVGTRNTSELEAASGVSNIRFEDLNSGTYLSFEDGNKPKKIKIDPNKPEAIMKAMGSLYAKTWGEGSTDWEKMKTALQGMMEEGQYEQFLAGAIEMSKPTQDISDVAVKGFADVFRNSGGVKEAIEPIAEALRMAEGASSPNSLTQRAFKTGGSSVITDIEHTGKSFGFFGTAGLKLTVSNPANSKETSTVTLDPNKPEDVKILEDLLRENIDYIPREYVEQLFGMNNDTNEGGSIIDEL